MRKLLYIKFNKKKTGLTEPVEKGLGQLNGIKIAIANRGLSTM